jgi:hypothetical protein
MPVEWCVLCAAAGLALAQPKPQEKTPPPDSELLEFIGSWETATGDWPELAAAVDKKPPEPPDTPQEPSHE